MQIDIPQIDTSSFNIREGNINDKDCFLVLPKNIGYKWRKDNLVFRSSIWDIDGNLISAGFKKFGNYGENPDVFTIPDKIGKYDRIEEKLDGSLLIVTYINGKLSMRTRGTFDARIMPNSDELNLLIQKYPSVFDNAYIRLGGHSLLLEWLSPSNVIILNYGDEPDLRLIGVVRHKDYTYFRTNELELLSDDLNISLPEQYKFKNIDDMIKSVTELKGKEGCVWYSKNGQHLLKIKSVWYLALHRVKSEINSIKNVVDVFFNRNKPTYQEFYDYIETTFDFELAETAKGNISKICDAYKEVTKIVIGMNNFVYKIKSLETRKYQAREIIGAYGKTNRAAFVFNILDGKDLTDDQVKKLLFQKLGL